MDPNAGVVWGRRPRVNSSRNLGSLHSVAEASEEDRAPLLLPGSELLDIPEFLLEGDWVLPQRKDNN